MFMLLSMVLKMKLRMVNIPFISPNSLGSKQATNWNISSKFRFLQLMQYSLSRKYITFVGLSTGFVVYSLIGHTQRKSQS